MRSPKPKPMPKPVDGLHLKRFVQPRRKFFTTTSDGRLLEISNPAIQFKLYEFKRFKTHTDPNVDSLGHKTCPRRRRCLRTVEGKPYTAIPDLVEFDEGEVDGTRPMRSDRLRLRDTLRKVVLMSPVFCATHDTTEDEMLDFLIWEWRKRPSHRVADAWCAPDLETVKGTDAVKVNPWHANIEPEWWRVKEMWGVLIRVFQLDALLCDNREEYSRVFSNGEDYRIADDFISYSLMGCIHFKLFDTADEELSFYTGLRESKQRTKHVIKYLNHRVLKHMTGRYAMVEEASDVVFYRTFRPQLNDEGFFNANWSVAELLDFRNYIDGSELKGEEPFQLVHKQWVDPFVERASAKVKSRKDKMKRKELDNEAATLRAIQMDSTDLDDIEELIL